jgi:hypothetical protein
MIWDDLFFISIKSDMDGVGVTITREILLVRRACMEENNGEGLGRGIGQPPNRHWGRIKGWNCCPKKTNVLIEF